MVISNSSWFRLALPPQFAISEHQLRMPILASHGFSDVVRNDNGPQYASFKIAEFLTTNNIQHAMYHHYPQRNAMVERYVQTVEILKFLKH